VYDPTDPVGQLLFNVLAMVAELESDLIRLRTREGIKVEKAPPLLLHSLYTGDAAPQNLMTAKTGSFRYPPPGIRAGPPTGVSAGQEPFAHVVAGEGFEPSKLSRWIYRPTSASA